MPTSPDPPETAELREQFAARHGILPTEDPDAVIDRIIAKATTRTVDLNAVTVVNAPAACELINTTTATLQGWRNSGYGPGAAPLAEPRWKTSKGNPGSMVAWVFEADFMVWLRRTEVGRGYLRRMVQDIQVGKVFPQYQLRPSKNGRPGGKKLVGFGFTPQDEPLPAYESSTFPPSAAPAELTNA